MALGKEFGGSAPTICDLCEAPIKEKFWDDLVVGGSKWGHLCFLCEITHGRGIGTQWKRKGKKWFKVV